MVVVESVINIEPRLCLTRNFSEMEHCGILNHCSLERLPWPPTVKEIY